MGIINKMATEAYENVMRVSGKRYHGAYVNAAKRIFENHAAIEIHGVAFAINNAIKAAEMLVTLGYADITGIETSNLPAQGEEGRVSAKVVVKMKKGAGFDKACEEYAKKSSS